MPHKTKHFTRYFLFIAIFFCPLFAINIANAQKAMKPDDLCGEWWTPENQGKINFFKNSDTYSGRIIYIKKNIDPETGKPILDKQNPDPKLRSRPVQNMVIINDFKYNDSKGKYIDGKLYNTENGKTYSCWIKMISKDVLEVHGFVGFSLIGRSVYFTRVQK